MRDLESSSDCPASAFYDFLLRSLGGDESIADLIYDSSPSRAEWQANQITYVNGPSSSTLPRQSVFTKPWRFCVCASRYNREGHDAGVWLGILPFQAPARWSVPGA